MAKGILGHAIHFHFHVSLCIFAVLTVVTGIFCQAQTQARRIHQQFLQLF